MGAEVEEPEQVSASGTSSRKRDKFLQAGTGIGEPGWRMMN